MLVSQGQVSKEVERGLPGEEWVACVRRRAGGRLSRSLCVVPRSCSSDKDNLRQSACEGGGLRKGLLT